MNKKINIDYKNENHIVYDDREVIFVRIEEFSEFSAKGYIIENLVLITKSGNRDSYVDVGALCYKTRLRTNKFTHFAKVDKNTFNENIAKAIKKYLSYKFLDLTLASARAILGELKVTIDELYLLSETGVDIRFDDLDNCHIIYEKYSMELISRLRNKLKDPEVTSTQSYAYRQQVCAELIASNCNIDINEFRSRYVKIKDYTSPNLDKDALVVDDNEYSKSVNQNKEIFYKVSDFITKNTNLPIVVDVIGGKESEKKYIYLVKKVTGEKYKYYLNEQGRFLSKLETVENIKKIDKVSKLNIRFPRSPEDLPWEIKDRYQSYEDSIYRANKLNSIERLRAINIAISACAMWILTDTGCNLSVIFDLETYMLDELKNDIKNHKILINKARANRKIPVTLSKRLLKGLKDYMVFRSHILENFSDKDQAEIGDSLFFCIGLSENDSTLKKLNSYSDKDLTNYKNWYENIFGSDKWINPRSVRLSNDNILKNLDNTQNDVLIRMGHTSSVNAKYYTEATKEQTRSQFSDFFNNVYGEMIFNNRKTTEVIPIVIDTESMPTIAGHCSNNIPVIANGFNESIESPNCSNPSTCLFCENYVLHTDDIDIRKLLSLRKITELYSNLSNDLMIVKYRVDEILKYITQDNEDLFKLIIDIKEEVDEGNLDENWENILELLMDLGVQFYD